MAETIIGNVNHLSKS